MDSLKVFNLVLILNMALLITGILALGAGAVVGVIFSSKTTTENIANETVQGLISVANSAAQGCQVSADEIQSTNISGLTGTSFTIDENWSQYLILNTDCIQSVSVQDNIQQLMAQEAQQLAQSISQQFQLSSAASKNVVNATADLSTQVSNSFNQQCSGYESQIQTFTLSDSTNVTGTIYLNWEQYNASTFSCVMQDEAVNNTTQQLDQDVNQQADATVKNFFAVLLGIVFAIFAMIGLIIFLLIFLRSLKPSQKPEGPTPAPSSADVDDQIAELLAQTTAPPIPIS